ncbi:hypothetical protein Q0Z83_007410 [Actinoplanes sichuanensis]|uniref:HEAT repeat domain-containing protein n=1 Tax=Actinoplanes sichuanensis TaxID=512349 RepID=A0ABW4AFT8_9ACTN|nr:hypothetical protein [Actinoplanes sichuanensis]BEL02550.1 hypothetical protein Q0Z83_007410 [Actinoplanes sichuanensis]
MDTPDSLPDLDDLLRFFVALDDQWLRRDGLEAFAARSDGSRLDTVLDAARDPWTQNRVHRHAAARATPAQLSRIVAEVHRRTDPFDRLTALARLLGRLDGAERAAAVEAAITDLPRIPDSDRSTALNTLLPRLEADEAARAIRAGLAVRGGRGRQVTVIAAIAMHLPEPVLDEAARDVGTIADEGTRATAIQRLSTGAGEARITHLIAAVDTLRDPLRRAQMLAGVARDAPARLRPELVATALALLVAEFTAGRREMAHHWALHPLLPLLDHGQVAELAASGCPHLTDLAAHAAPETVVELVAIRLAPDSGFSSLNLLQDLARLIGHLPAGHREAATDDLIARLRPGSWPDTFAGLVPHLTDEQVDAAVGRAGPEELLVLGPRLSAPRIAAAFDAAYTIGNGVIRTGLLTRMVERLDGSRLDEVIAHMSAIRDPLTRFDALDGLRRVVPADRQAAVTALALAAASAVRGADMRAFCLMGLATDLPADLRRTALERAATAIRAIRDSETRARRWVSFVPLLPTA